VDCVVTLLLPTLLCGHVEELSPADSPADKPVKHEFVDVLGDKYTLPGPDDCKAVVLLFVGYDCPISNSYSKEIVRLCKEFMPKKVAFCVVYADADINEDEARKHAKEYGFVCPAILDPEMTLARRVGATIKPEAAVLSPKGELLYLGRIDNRWVDFGKRREHVTCHELRDALGAVLAGRPIATPRVKGVGCDIDLPKKSK
jgi:hypothetical protein